MTHHQTKGLSAVDGKKLSEQRLDGLPAWDGLIATRGRLFLTMQDGTVKCFGSESTVEETVIERK